MSEGCLLEPAEQEGKYRVYMYTQYSNYVLLSE
eukprot:COSAG02_NODE_293_length_25438_cov_52.630254_23_plen_33_part_00